MVNSLDTGMPTARAICMSSTPARIIAPRRVRSIKRCSPIAVTTAMPSTTRRYAGKAILPTTSGRCSEAGAAIGIGSPPHTIRQTSATMNEMPSVTSTCPSAFPARRRRMNRSSRPPNAATSSPESSAASQRFGKNLSSVTPRYAPSMNNEPCVRFAIRISPKINENPAASRNSSPPRARLFNVWTIQNCMPTTSARAPSVAAQGSRFFAGGQSREYTGFLRNSFGS